MLNLTENRFILPYILKFILHDIIYHDISYDYNTIIIIFLLSKYFVYLKDLKEYIYIYLLFNIYVYKNFNSHFIIN